MHVLPTRVCSHLTVISHSPETSGSGYCDGTCKDLLNIEHWIHSICLTMLRSGNGEDGGGWEKEQLVLLTAHTHTHTRRERERERARIFIGIFMLSSVCGDVTIAKETFWFCASEELRDDPVGFN